MMLMVGKVMIFSVRSLYRRNPSGIPPPMRLRRVKPFLFLLRRRLIFCMVNNDYKAKLPSLRGKMLGRPSSSAGRAKTDVWEVVCRTFSKKPWTLSYYRSGIIMALIYYYPRGKAPLMPIGPRRQQSRGDRGNFPLRGYRLATSGWFLRASVALFFFSISGKNLGRTCQD